MKGYKALDKDMQAIYGNGMQFELGKKYTVKGEVFLCRNGFHFCKKIEYLDSYYDIGDSRIFEIETYGKIKKKHQKYAAEGIKLIRELTGEEIYGYFKQNQQLLVRNKDWQVRCAVAKQGCGLDVLIQDECWAVRKQVAGRGYGLDILVRDDSWHVRIEVAKQNYGLDMLVHDEYWAVRKQVARQRYGLNVLMYDESRSVRQEVAKQGYGLDVLINDKEYDVRMVAKAVADGKNIPCIV